MTWDTVAIVGVGLIGGSIGLAVKERRLARCVLGVGRRSGRLAAARRRGAIDQATTRLEEAAANAELIVVCTPVDCIARHVLQAARHCRRGTLLTDAGSTKAGIVAALDGRLADGVTFVGSHPLAGSEKQGVEHARADLFVERLCIVTPSRRTPRRAVERTLAFWRQLGAVVETLTPEAHDRIVAHTSHLPHVVASALSGSLPARLRKWTASGWRDTTRVAAGDPDLWAAILEQNREATLAALDRFEGKLARLRQALAGGEAKALRTLLAEAKRSRDALGS